MDINWRKDWELAARETPRSLIEKYAMMAWASPYAASSRRSGTLQEYIRNGGDPDKAPDHMLPGRFFMSLPEDVRGILGQLTSEDTTQSGLWWCHVAKPQPEPRSLSEIVAKHAPRKYGACGKH